MIYHIRGELVALEAAYAVIDCHGVGYKLSISLNTYNEIVNETGKEILLLTHMQVREDAVELYGFATDAELQCFKLLLTVSGVGPKAGMAVLSIFTPDRFSYAVTTEDARSIAKASGVGAKTAARIVLELKDKISREHVTGELRGMSDKTSAPKQGAASSGGKLSEAVDALTVLGYNRSEILDVLRTIDTSLELEEIITLALKKMATR